MADRRMISKRIINSARFQKMPISSQALYFFLCIEADDDGVVEAYQVIRQTGCGEDDLRVLVAKGFITVLNEDLVSFISDWREHNHIRADRKIDSIYKDLLISVVPEANLLERRQRADRKGDEDDGTSQGRPGDGIGKDRIGKDRLEQDSIDKPNGDDIEEVVTSFCLSDALTAKVSEWLGYKKEKKQAYKPKGLKTLLNKIKTVSDTYGDDPVCEAIDRSMVNNWAGIFFEDIQKNYRPVEHSVKKKKEGERE